MPINNTHGALFSPDLTAINVTQPTFTPPAATATLNGVSIALVGAPSLPGTSDRNTGAVQGPNQPFNPIIRLVNPPPPPINPSTGAAIPGEWVNCGGETLFVPAGSFFAPSGNAGFDGLDGPTRTLLGQFGRILGTRKIDSINGFDLWDLGNFKRLDAPAGRRGGPSGALATERPWRFP